MKLFLSMKQPYMERFPVSDCYDQGSYGHKRKETLNYRYITECQ